MNKLFNVLVVISFNMHLLFTLWLLELAKRLPSCYLLPKGIKEKIHYCSSLNRTSCSAEAGTRDRGHSF